MSVNSIVIHFLGLNSSGWTSSSGRCDGWQKMNITVCFSQKIKRFYFHDDSLQERSILLTFDDLYQSVLDFTYPVPAELKMKACGFLVGDCIFPKARSRSPHFSRTLSGT